MSERRERSISAGESACEFDNVVKVGRAGGATIFSSSVSLSSRDCEFSSCFWYLANMQGAAVGRLDEREVRDGRRRAQLQPRMKEVREKPNREWAGERDAPMKPASILSEMQRAKCERDSARQASTESERASDGRRDEAATKTRLLSSVRVQVRAVAVLLLSVKLQARRWSRAMEEISLGCERGSLGGVSKFTAHSTEIHLRAFPCDQSRVRKESEGLQSSDKSLEKLSFY